MKNLLKAGFVLCILLIALTCKKDGKTENQTITAQPNNEKISGSNPIPKTSSTLITFYDFNAQRSYMEYRRVKIKTATGDPVRDAVGVFLRQNRVGPNLSRFKLDQIMVENDVSIFMISGLSKIEDNEYKPLFKTALDSTIIYNYPNKAFKIIVNGEEL